MAGRASTDGKGTTIWFLNFRLIVLVLLLAAIALAIGAAVLGIKPGPTGGGVLTKVLRNENLVAGILASLVAFLFLDRFRDYSQSIAKLREEFAQVIPDVIETSKGLSESSAKLAEQRLKEVMQNVNTLEEKYPWLAELDQNNIQPENRHARLLFFTGKKFCDDGKREIAHSFLYAKSLEDDGLHGSLADLSLLSAFARYELDDDYLAYDLLRNHNSTETLGSSLIAPGLILDAALLRRPGDVIALGATLSRVVKGLIGPYWLERVMQSVGLSGGRRHLWLRLSPTVHYAIAYAEAAAGQVNRAEAALARARGLIDAKRPATWQGMALKALTEHQLGRHPAARQSAAAAIASSGGAFGPRKTLFLLLVSLGEMQQALEVLGAPGPTGALATYEERAAQNWSAKAHAVLAASAPQSLGGLAL
ncbi:hypothetical protein AMEJIAPC_00494 [Caulobacter sp. NIBR1757]|nr:hypothetical protein AMEJIAPC_00494 [Caulobacter sp. NIBR1757]